MTPIRKRVQWLACPVCETCWSSAVHSVGAKCGDTSSEQRRPCVGRLMPEADYKKAEWRGLYLRAVAPLRRGETR